MLRLANAYWNFLILGFVGGKTKVTQETRPQTETEKEIDRISLERLRRQEAQSAEFDPIIEQQLRDLREEEAVRAGGKVGDVLRPIEGAPPQRTLDQFINELRAGGRFTTPAVPADERSGEILSPAIPASTNEAALGLEAQRLFGAQVPSTEIDTEATAARQKRFEDIIAREEEGRARSERQAEIASEISELQLADIKRGGAATPEQLALIGEATAAAQKTGEADIERFRTATLRQINEEIASASGLRPTDTPIVRLSERAGEEASRQQGILTSRLAETNATARLNFPLAQSQLQSSIAGSQQGLALAAQSFQDQLKQRAIDNRFRLFAINPTNSLGFSNTQLGAQTSSRGPSIGEVGQLVGGVGALVSAFSSTAPAATTVASTAASDRRLKRDIFKIGELASGIPFYIFKYKGYEGWHVGVIADEVVGVIPEAVLEDERGIQYVRYDLLH